MDADREEQMKFAARYGDRATFERLGGSDQQWLVMRATHGALNKRNLTRGIV